MEDLIRNGEPSGGSPYIADDKAIVLDGDLCVERIAEPKGPRSVFDVTGAPTPFRWPHKKVQAQEFLSHTFENVYGSDLPFPLFLEI